MDIAKEAVFGLDIGTRSVVGIVGIMKDGVFHVKAQFVKEHDTRAMLDGQIHDIAKVGETIRVVKEKLEKKLRFPLTRVSVAAAGRVLRTIQVHVEEAFEQEKTMSEDDMHALRAEAARKAYEEFQATYENGQTFYCVGYSPVRFYMNGYQISNPEGHKVKSVGVDLIATFLPEDVVDGLYKAVEYAGLQVGSLTLEPIAAIRVAIPEKFRMLNMALVDVGAGTSDICITREGAVTAYGMIPVAGDSLTDLIVQHCLVEFAEAEQMKRKVGNGEDVEYTDIFGVVNTITQEALKEILRPGLEEMAKLAAEEIIRLNGEQPVSAVFVVGGGGIVPGYTALLADKLGVSAERVAIRGREVLQSISFDIRNAIQDSLMVTPIGICLSTYDQGNSFTVVELNGIRCKLYNNGRLTISDVIMQAEYPKEDLFPKRGKSVSYIENGKTHIKRGKPGEACRILVNGEEADFTTPIANGDKIEIIPSTRGADAVLEPGQMPVTGKLNVPASMVNQKAEDTVTEESVESDWEQEEQYEEEPEDEPVVRKPVEASVIKKPVEEPEPGIVVIANKQPVFLKGKKNFVYVDVFDYIDFDTTHRPAGKQIMTQLNGRPAQYMEEIKEGDIIDIFWD